MSPSRTAPGLLAALGLVLITQFATSLASGLLFLGPFVDTQDADAVARDTAASLTTAYAGIGLDIVTALAIAALGVLFARVLREQGSTIAAMGLVMFTVEAGLLLVSKLLAYGFVSAARADAPVEVLQPLLDTSEFAYSLHMVPFCIGATLFYLLLLRSGIVPRWLGWWGFLALIPVSVGTLLGIVGVPVPFAVMLPYAPFELVAGVWLCIRGLQSPAGPTHMISA